MSFKVHNFLIILSLGAMLVHSSVIAPVPAPIAYTNVAPQAIAPFANSVSTFTRGLNIFAAPYAAGVLPPGVIAGPSPLLPAPFAAPAPLVPAPAPALSAVPYAAPPAPFAPGVVPAPVVPGPSPFGYFSAPAVAPAPYALAARSIHAFAPGIAPVFG